MMWQRDLIFCKLGVYDISVIYLGSKSTERTTINLMWSGAPEGVFLGMEESIYAPMHQWDKCINLSGTYVEK